MSVKIKDGVLAHQSFLRPEQNKFHLGNGVDKKHYWLTPPALFQKLNAEFSFDFDPCPYPKPESFDGLTQPWGMSSYVNPPFGSIIHEGKKKGPTAWVRKAIDEHRQGKRVVLVYPIDKWVLMLLAAGAKVRNLGDVRWHAIEDGSQGKGTGRHIACFVLDQSDEANQPAPEWQGEVVGYTQVPDARSLHVLKAASDEPQFDPEDFTSVDTRLYFWRTGWNACRDTMLAAASSAPQGTEQGEG